MDKVFNTLFIVIGFLFILLLIIFRQTQALFITIGLLAVVFVFNAYFMVRYLTHKKRRIASLTLKLKEKEDIIHNKEKVEAKLSTHIPVGILLVNDQFDIVWANSEAKKIFENLLESRNLDMINKPIKDKIQLGDAQQTFTMKIYEHKYDITYDETLKAIYFFKVTEREEIKQHYYNQTNSIGILHLDNLEEAITVLDVQEKSSIQGKYLGALDDWAEANGFYIVPVTSSKIIAFLHRKNLDILLKQQFKIIETIQNISRENDLIVTLSGGFACANLPLNELGELAQESLDLSLSRGGDQIVVNVQGEPPKYFGGNTNTQEKRTRVSSRINAQKIATLFEESDDIFIMPHHHPDTDAFGSAIGMLKIAEALNKKAYIVLNFNALDKTVKKILQLMEYEYVTFLEHFISIDEALSMVSRSSVLVLVDHHSYGQLIDERILNKIPNRIIIDHHRKLTDFIEESRLHYIEPYASSTSELIVEMMDVFQKSLEINPFEATIMLSGIIVDTNNFMYRTGARTFEAAAVLRKFGADTYKIKTILRESLQEIQIKSRLLTLAEVIKKRFSIVVVPDNIDTDRILLAQIADDLLEIDNTVAAFAIGQLDSQSIGISARSLEGFNVQTIMEKFGGGGHLNNAGAQLESHNLDDVKTKLIEILENTVQEEKPMKVILKKDVKNKGKKGEVIDVAPGYGNYLLTSKQAIEATSENMQIIEEEKDKKAQEAQQELDEAKKLKQRIDFRAVKVYVKIGENGRLYGKINTKQIADAFKEQHGIEIDKRKIQLDQPITALGTYQIDVKIHKDVTATFELLVLEA
ncbi:MAG: 50S ribosomal protein L9 [Bacillota bacterium]